VRDLKTERLATALFDILTQRLAVAYPATAIPVIKNYDANNDVYLTVTVTPELDAIIKFEPDAAPASGAVDSLGITQTVFNPHIIRVGFDIGTQASVTATLATAVATNAVTVNGVTFTAVASGATGNQWNIGGTDAISAANLAAAINASTTAGAQNVIAALANGSVVTIYSIASGAVGNLIAVTKTGVPITLSGANLASGDLTTMTPELVKFQVLIEAIKCGLAVYLYEASGITTAKLVAANLIGVVRDVSWGILAQV
jgi:hypothetical protein